MVGRYGKIGFFFVFPVPARTVCTDNEVRLQGGITATQGRVEICRENIWTSVCGQEWDREYAELICEELGHRRDGGFVSNLVAIIVWPESIIIFAILKFSKYCQCKTKLPLVVHHCSAVYCKVLLNQLYIT